MTNPEVDLTGNGFLYSCKSLQAKQKKYILTVTVTNVSVISGFWPGNPEIRGKMVNNRF